MSVRSQCIAHVTDVTPCSSRRCDGRLRSSGIYVNAAHAVPM